MFYTDFFSAVELPFDFPAFGGPVDSFWSFIIVIAAAVLVLIAAIVIIALAVKSKNKKKTAVKEFAEEKTEYEVPEAEYTDNNDFCTEPETGYPEESVSYEETFDDVTFEEPYEDNTEYNEETEDEEEELTEDAATTATTFFEEEVILPVYEEEEDTVTEYKEDEEMAKKTPAKKPAAKKPAAKTTAKPAPKKTAAKPATSDSAKGKYIVSKTDAGKFRFILKATNGQLLFESRDYASKASAKSGITSFKSAVESGEFTIEDDKSGRFKFRLQKGAQFYEGETVNRRAQVENTIESVKKNAASDNIVDETIPAPEKE